MKILCALAVSTLLLFPAMPAAAQHDTLQIKAALKQRFPDAPVDSVRKVPYGNLFEVVGGGEVYYTDEKASFLMLGHLIDAKTRENVTEIRLRQVNAIQFDALPFDAAIKIVRGSGARKVAIFEDPNCGYCKRFERDLAGVTDITVYVFLYPILSADSLEKSKAIWCAPDRGKAWLDLMLRESPSAADAKCETPIEQVLALGREKRIQGTPTIVFEDGQRVPGAMTIAQFEARLVAAKAAGAKAAAK